MAELVDDDHLLGPKPGQRPDRERSGGSGRVEGLVLHPHGPGAVLRRVDAAHLGVGVGKGEESEPGEGPLLRVCVPRPLADVVGLHVETKLDGTEPGEEVCLGPAEELRRARELGLRDVLRRVEGVFLHDVARVCRPGEVVDRRLLVDQGLLPARARLLHERSRRAHDVTLRDGDGDPVVAPVGVELRVGVVLVRVPAGLGPAPPPLRLEDADLRVPLPDHEEVPDVSCPGEDLGNARLPRDLEGHGLTRRNGLRKGDGKHRAVFEVAVVGRLEPGAWKEVGPLPDHRGQVDRAEAFILVGLVPSQLAARFPEKRRPVVPEGVPVEVELQLGDRNVRGVGPAECFPACQLATDFVEGDPDVVIDDFPGRRKGLGRERRHQNAERSGCGEGPWRHGNSFQATRIRRASFDGRARTGTMWKQSGPASVRMIEA